MDLSNIALFNVMQSKLKYLSERQGVLAQNVANVDTPGYRAKDIAKPDFAKIASQVSYSSDGMPAQKLQPAQTDPKHMVKKPGNGGMWETQYRASTYEMNPTGNNVSVEEEMMKMAENQSEYNKVLSLYRKTVDMFKTAVGRPGGGA